MNKAIIVREKVSRLVKMLTDKSVTVTQRGSSAYVQYNSAGCPSVVNIPYIPDDASDEFLAAIEGFLDHEVAHVLFTDYAQLKRAKSGGVANLHNIIEDAFIEKRMADYFTGSGTNLRSVGTFFLENHTTPKLLEEGADAVGLLMVPAIRSLSGQALYTEYMHDKWHYMDAIMKKIGEYARDALPKIASTKDAVDAALKIKELLDPKDEPGEGEGEGKGSSKKSKGKSSKASKGADKASSGKPDKESPEDSEESGDPSEEPGEFDDSGESDESPEGTGEEDGDEGEDSGGKEDPKESGPEEDEGEDEDKDDGKEDKAAPSSSELEDSLSGEDYDKAISELLSSKALEEARSSEYMIYTKEFDVIEPMPIGHGDDALLKAMQDEVDHMVGPMQKDLERAVAARSASTWSAGHRSGRLHASALSRLTAFGDDRAFRRKHENTTKDVAVELLVDCSGSMRCGKIQTAAHAAYALSSILDRMNIANEVIGFTTRRHTFPGASTEAHRAGISYARMEALYVPILKGFGERLTAENKKRFAALPSVTWLRENVDGESVQVAATRLLARREKRKILMVLSDGHPACPGDFMALRSHLKKTVREVERQGVDVLGLGIQSDAPKEFYSKYVLLNDIDELPNTVISEIKRLLMKA